MFLKLLGSYMLSSKRNVHGYLCPKFYVNTTVFSNFLQSNYAACFLRLLFKNQIQLLLWRHYSLLRNHLNNIWPLGVFMFQDCVPVTGKQEVNIPLGVLKSEFSWKIFQRECFLSLQCALLSMHSANKGEKPTLCISTQISLISFYSIHCGFSFFIYTYRCFSALVSMIMLIW